jgi:hypothetical protein
MSMLGPKRDHKIPFLNVKVEFHAFYIASAINSYPQSIYFPECSHGEVSEAFT